MTDQAVVAVFGSSATGPGTAHWEDAGQVGRRLAEAGFGVVTGGTGGRWKRFPREILIAWNLNTSPVTTAEFESHVAFGEGWRRLHEVMPGMRASPDDVEIAASVDDALGWLLDQSEMSHHLTTH